MRLQNHPKTILAVCALAGIMCAGVNLPCASAQLTGILSQGVTMTMTTTANGRTTTSTHYFSGNASKAVTGTGADTIVRFDQQKIISIDNQKKTYSEMTFQEMQAMMDQIGKGMGDAAADPEAMAAIKKMMGGGNDTPLKVTMQGPGDPIAGYATEKYLVTGPMDIQIWAAPDLKVPAAYYDSMKIRLPSNPIMDLGKMYDAFKQVNGWPVKYVMTIKMMGRSMVTTNEVTSVQKGAIPPATFDVPAGYQKVAEKMK
jgi:hypothetical protein